MQYEYPLGSHDYYFFLVRSFLISHASLRHFHSLLRIHGIQRAVKRICQNPIALHCQTKPGFFCLDSRPAFLIVKQCLNRKSQKIEYKIQKSKDTRCGQHSGPSHQSPNPNNKWIKIIGWGFYNNYTLFDFHCILVLFILGFTYNSSN